jgi:hypothetical protein
MNAYEVRVAEGRTLSLSNMWSYKTYTGEIVRVDTGDVAYRTKLYQEANTARLQAARLRKNYEHYLVKHGVGFEQQEAERKANERAERDAKREADRRVRDAAHDLLAALLPLVEGSPVSGGMIRFDGDELRAARAAIAKAREG